MKNAFFYYLCSKYIKKKKSVLNINRSSIIVWLKRISLFFIVTLLLLITYLFIFEIPSSESLRHPIIKEASKVYDRKDSLLGIFEEENRILLTYKVLNPLIVKGVIAVEDERFLEHGGVDFKALSRVLVKTILLQKEEAGGGSTITQQLAKQLYARPSFKKKNILIRSFLLFKSKIKEWIIASKLENIFSKEDILTMYLNKFEFINGAHGIEAAANTYFGKNQSELSIAETATLIGMLKNPSLYNPVRFPDKTLARRNVVLKKMGQNIKFNIDSIQQTKLDISRYQRKKYIEGPVPHFRSELAKWLQKTIKENSIRKPDGTLYDIYADGLRIETTIDMDFQQYAEEASREHMAWLQNWFTIFWRKKDPWTYKADDAQKKMRNDALMSKVKASTRYKLLESKFKNSDELQKAYQVEFFTKRKMKIYDHLKGSKEAEMTPYDSVKYHATLLQNAMILMDPRNGHVLTWIGALDHNYFQFDHVTSRRSIGSTMKPFLYTLAMQEKGIKPCQSYPDVEYTIAPFESNFKNKELWAPHNATEIYTTLQYNLYHGLLYSKNSITVKLLKEIGSIEPLRNLLDKVGISKTEKLPNGRLAVPELPSVALGAVDISLLQLTAAYATFANQGKYIEPIFVKCIKNREGKIIYQPKQKKTQAIDPLYNSIMVDMLKNVVGGEFTMNLKTENGGKTGTTNDQSDGWFMGITPTLVGGVWTGGDDKWIRFTQVDIGQGYFTARPAFERFMKKLEADKSGIFDSKIKFQKPPDGFKELTNCAKIKTESLPEFLRPKKLDSLKVKTIAIEKDTVKLEK